MSGHGSLYCFKLAKMLLKKQKSYITMIGGIHVSEDLSGKEYYENAHHIIVHTEVQKKQLLQKEIFKNLNIQVMPLGIDTAVFTPKKKTSNTLELLFVGRISRLKQIELCLKTLAFLIKNQDKEVSLTIVGPISDEIYFGELKALAEHLKITERIKFVGSIEQKELVPYYQNANLLLLPSAHESFGMVMVEAMACGTPVAALLGSGGPDEIIENSLNGILVSKENYAENILNYFKDKEIEVRLSKNAREMAVQKWSLSQTENALRNSVNQVFR